MEYFVYIIESVSTGKRYVGQTSDLDRRVAEHNCPRHNPRKHTSRNAGPWKLVHQQLHRTRSEAMQREKWLKSGIGRQWIATNLGSASPPKAD
ncbi:MAG: GIY-YIG nuclease family protein [Phycisphaerales bacterium]|nr:MAG: GIY-YIG nuclease family protein [Phycisphaerales bacterium]